MSIFTSGREKQFWFYALVVLVIIISTLVFGRPFADLFGNQNIQAVIFLLVMILIGTIIIMHAVKISPGKTELIVWLGFAAVFIMLFLRLGLAERSHLMEYGVLAIFIHMALMERFDQKKHILRAAIFAFIITSAIGIIDECIQIFLPDRIFDPNDILFNGFAAFGAIGSRIALQWIRIKLKKT